MLSEPTDVDLHLQRRENVRDYQCFQHAILTRHILLSRIFLKIHTLHLSRSFCQFLYELSTFSGTNVVRRARICTRQCRNSNPVGSDIELHMYVSVV